MFKKIVDVKSKSERNVISNSILYKNSSEQNLTVKLFCRPKINVPGSIYFKQERKGYPRNS